MVNLDRGRVVGFEALARWQHPEWGSIPPSDFISVAEETGLILPLGRWAMDHATATLARWDKACGTPIDAYIAVNVSAVQLTHDDLPGVAAHALEASGLKGERLLVELTESALLRDPERSARMLRTLKEMGITIAMDDFGTGYSSLANLQRLPIDVLKIDRSLITGLLDDQDSVAVVRAILSLASALGMATTAEGIETADLARTLAGLGCVTGQGFHFARPLDSEAALRYFLAFNRQDADA